MTSRDGGDSAPTLDEMLTSERAIEPASEALRGRVMSRVRRSVEEARGVAHVSSAPRRRHAHALKLVAVPIALSAAWAVAFQVGYEFRDGGAPAVLDGPLVPTPVEAAHWVPRSPPVSAEELSLVEAVAAAPDAPPRGSTGPRLEAYAKEFRVLQPAQRAVANRDFAGALGPISEHQRQFPSGVLSEEREALRVRTLVGLNRLAEARDAATRFRARFPKSPLLGRIDALLGSEK